MWQDIAAFSTVGATVAGFVWQAVRRRRTGESGGCSSCENSKRIPGSAPTYIIPMESLMKITDRPDDHAGSMTHR
ncbi:MAG: hypothetical protein O3A46_08530 [Candidatus Poribacteria bacterium]|nr:hypothetical protein [Candidatus Poribacteria bacterium]